MRGNKPRIRSGLVAAACSVALSVAGPAAGAGWYPRIPASGDFVGAYTDAIDSLARSWEGTGPTSSVTLRWMLRNSELLRLSGRYDEAERLLRRANSTGHAHPGPEPALELELCIQWVRLGRQLEGDPSVVDSSWERGRRLAQEHPSTPTRLHADLWQARANQLRARGDRAGALAHYARALALRRADPSATREALADNLTWFSWLRLVDGDAAGARAGLEEARELLDLAGHDRHPLRCTIEGNLARLDEEASGLSHAAAGLARTVRTCGEARAGLPAGAPRRGYLVPDDRARLALYLSRSGRGGEAWPLVVEGFGPEATLARAIAVARASLGCTPATPIPRQGAALRREELAELRADAAWQRCLQLAAATTGRGAPPSRHDVQSQLDPSTAMVAWFDLPPSLPPVDGSRAWAMVLRHEGPLEWLPLEDATRPLDRERVARTRRRLRAAAEWPFRVDADPGLEEDSRELGRRWLDPVLTRLAGVERIVVLPPSGRLGVEAWRAPSGEELAAELELVHVVSPQVYAMPASAPAPGRRGALVVAPAVGLPGVSSELASIALHFPGLVLLQGKEANVGRLLELAGEGSAYELVHLSTHAGTSRRFPGRSWVALSDRQLHASEIPLHWRAPTDLVVLNACRSVQGPSTGAGYVGFADHFLAAGARAVLVHRWPVPDAAASLFMQHFYDAWRGEGAPLATAMRRARVALRDHVDREGRRPWAHPAYWAGYLLVAGAPAR